MKGFEDRSQSSLKTDILMGRKGEWAPGYNVKDSGTVGTEYESTGASIAAPLVYCLPPFFSCADNSQVLSRLVK